MTMIIISLSKQLISYHHQVSKVSLLLLLADAIGFQNYIMDHGCITLFENNHQSPDEYIILNNENLNDIDNKMQSQITQLKFAGRFCMNESIPSIDFSSYHFNQVEIIRTGCLAFKECLKVIFKSIN